MLQGPASPAEALAARSRAPPPPGLETLHPLLRAFGVPPRSGAICLHEALSFPRTHVPAGQAHGQSRGRQRESGRPLVGPTGRGWPQGTRGDQAATSRKRLAVPVTLQADPASGTRGLSVIRRLRLERGHLRAQLGGAGWAEGGWAGRASRVVSGRPAAAGLSAG